MRKIRLNESQFNRIVSKCVNKALNEHQSPLSDYEWVNSYIYQQFLKFNMDSIDAGDIADILTQDVLNDVIETADDVNSEDVNIALTRVLKQRLGIVN